MKLALLTAAALLLLVCVSGDLATAAPPGGVIQGTVRNGTTSAAVPNASVELLLISTQGPEGIGQTRSDGQGRFEFRGVSGGRYLLQVKHQGVSYATHAVVTGGAPVQVVLQIFDVSAQVPLRVTLLGLAIDVQAGYVRVSEVVHLRNATSRTLLGDVSFPLPRGARYVTFMDGLHQPRVEGARIVDRLVVRPGEHQLGYAYSVAGGGEIALDRRLVFALERLEVFVSAPAEARAAPLRPLPTVTTDEGQTYTRASGRNVPAGDFAIAVIGVPSPRLWLAPAAAGALAALLIAGLAWAVIRGF